MGLLFSRTPQFFAEEMNADDGEMVVGFCMKKKSHSPEREKIKLVITFSQIGTFIFLMLFLLLFWLFTAAPLEVAQKPKKQFSLDFPPGLVDLDSKTEPTSKQWNSIKKILGHD